MTSVRSIFFLVVPALVLSGAQAFGVPHGCKANCGKHAATASATQDPIAVATITQALAVLGGGAAQVLTVQINGTSIFAGDTTNTSNVITDTFEVTASGYEFRKETRNGSDDYLFVSGHGTPAHSYNGTVNSFQSYVAAPVAPDMMPAMALQAILANRAYVVSTGASQQIGTVNAVHVQTANTNNPDNQPYTVQDWFFDPVTFLPVEVQSAVPDPQNAAITSICIEDFANYQNMSGYLVPTQVTVFSGSTVLETVTTSSLIVNQPVNQSDFDLKLPNAPVQR